LCRSSNRQLFIDSPGDITIIVPPGELQGGYNIIFNVDYLSSAISNSIKLGISLAKLLLDRWRKPANVFGIDSGEEGL